MCWSWLVLSCWARKGNTWQCCDAYFQWLFTITKKTLWIGCCTQLLSQPFVHLDSLDLDLETLRATGFFKKNNHPHIHGQRELFAPPCPQLNVGHSGCTQRPSKKTTILVTGASHYNLLQHWVGGAGGAAIALLDVDVVVFLKNPGNKKMHALRLCVCAVWKLSSS